jgi:hypothetical protein
MTRVLRGIAAVLLLLLATILLVVSLVLSITMVLMPIGVPILIASIWLFKKALQLLLPRNRDVQLALRKALHIREIRRSVRKGRRRAQRPVRRFRKRAGRLVARAR